MSELTMEDKIKRIEERRIEDDLSGFSQLVDWLEYRKEMNCRGMARDDVLACGVKFANAPVVKMTKEERIAAKAKAADTKEFQRMVKRRRNTSFYARPRTMN
jgi:hypothetical protein